MKRSALFLAVLGMTVLWGCGPSKELTRNKAKAMLDKVAVQTSFTHITLSREQAIQLANSSNDFVEEKSIKLCLPDPNDVRVQTGQYASCFGVIPPGVSWQRPGVLTTFKKPYTWTLIEVTGISDGQTPNEKDVEYTWVFSFPNYPPSGQDALKLPPRPGKALFRLYDDGWRFVKFE